MAISPQEGGFMPAAQSPNTKSREKSKHKRAFDVQSFLDSAGVARKIVEYRTSEKIYSQGEPATKVMYLQKGGVKLTVVNQVGKEAVLAILGPGDFFGEGSMAGQPVRMGTATAITPTTLLVIEKQEMIRVPHTERAFSDRFVTYMLSRNIRIEEDLIDQLFNSSEKRLARTLLLLARYGKGAKPQTTIPKVSQEVLAEYGRHNQVTRELFHEQIQETGFHSVQWRTAGSQFPSERCSARLSRRLARPSEAQVGRWLAASIHAAIQKISVFFDG
jgi:CRP/FNR family transcriptional regulator, cyclic AMP receptor protein